LSKYKALFNNTVFLIRISIILIKIGFAISLIATTKIIIKAEAAEII